MSRKNNQTLFNWFENKEGEAATVTSLNKGK